MFYWISELFQEILNFKEVKVSVIILFTQIIFTFFIMKLDCKESSTFDITITFSQIVRTFSEKYFVGGHPLITSEVFSIF